MMNHSLNKKPLSSVTTTSYVTEFLISFYCVRIQALYVVVTRVLLRIKSALNCDFRNLEPSLGRF
jgi:hypothetical protein